MISKELFDRAAALLSFPLPANAFGLFDAYAEALVTYNEKVNLTAITDPDEIVTKHFLDSLFLLNAVSPAENAAVCDVGTGAGFPGLCLAIARPDLRVTLFDSVNKKLAFLRSFSGEAGIPVAIVTVRAEDAGRDPAYRERFDLCTARAVAQLNRLAEYCVPLVKPGGLFAPLKAPLSPEEAQRGIGAAANLGARLTNRLRYRLPDGSDREVPVFEKTAPTPTKYPRNPAQIAKKPL